MELRPAEGSRDRDRLSNLWKTQGRKQEKEGMLHEGNSFWLVPTHALLPPCAVHGMNCLPSYGKEFLLSAYFPSSSQLCPCIDAQLSPL